MLTAFMIGAFGISYYALGILFSLFFNNAWPTFSKRARTSVPFIMSLASIAYILGMTIPDLELANRVQHALGGFVAYVSCHLAVRDLGINVGVYRFTFIALLMVASLGIANEIMEFGLQSTSLYVFSNDPYDTWLDLISNSVGEVIAASIVFFLVRKPS